MAAYWEDLRERERKSMMVSIRSQLVLGTGCSQDGGKVWALPKARSDLNESVYGSFMFFFPILTFNNQEVFVWPLEP